ncbi:MAG: GTPase ObgE [Anaerolineae bacterium]|nr:GTPase ObgE [Anaerolineae bacterium]MCO5204491.1 GTPase ObgE [Anaerolineae bacterium]
MFFDEAKIYIKGGDGGDGLMAFRREKYVPFGGPSGGDGGTGGDIIFVVNPKLNNLSYYHRNIHFKAGDGQRGGQNRMTGANGETLRLEVPPGTVIRNAETGAVLADLTEPGQEATLITGGRHGRGNIRFVSSTNQAPRIAERGERGEEMWVTLELKLIADVGLVGKPNAGKSTLLSVISAARPKIADYPFTTLQPNLGVVQLDEYGDTFVVADIPGLIEGAAEGHGLGHDFLRHIERTRVLVHLLDGSAPEPLEDWKQINAELAMYGAGLEDRPQLVVLNKMDLPDAIAWEPIIAEIVGAAGYAFTSISAVTGERVRDMLYRVKQLLAEAPDPTSLEDEHIVIRPKSDPEQFHIERTGSREWRVVGENVTSLAARTYFDLDGAAMRFQRILDKLGVNEALREAGVRDGDMVSFGEIELEWQEVY